MVDGMRTMEMGSPGKMRAWLNDLILSGRKVGTFGLFDEYVEEGEPVEEVGERLCVVDDDLNRVAVVETVDIRRLTVGEVTWAMVESEGEGDRSVAEWRAGHDRYWRSEGLPGLADDTQLVWQRFRLVDPAPPILRVTAGDLDLPEGYRGIYSGKVRDLFEAPGGALLFVASDRISAYDWVLPTTIPDKGAILTQLSLWWFEQMADLVGNHVLSTDVPASVSGSRDALPAADDVPRRVRGAGLPDGFRTGRVPGVGLRVRDRAAGRAGGRVAAARADLHARDQGRAGRA